jgi:hypothetical protein
MHVYNVQIIQTLVGSLSFFSIGIALVATDVPLDFDGARKPLLSFPPRSLPPRASSCSSPCWRSRTTTSPSHPPMAGWTAAASDGRRPPALPAPRCLLFLLATPARRDPWLEQERDDVRNKPINELFEQKPIEAQPYGRIMGWFAAWQSEKYLKQSILCSFSKNLKTWELETETFFISPATNWSDFGHRWCKYYDHWSNFYPWLGVILHARINHRVVASLCIYSIVHNI